MKTIAMPVNFLGVNSWIATIVSVTINYIAMINILCDVYHLQ